MIKEGAQNSLLLLDILLAKTVDEINQFEDVKYEVVLDTKFMKKISVLLNQIYQDRSAGNFKAAIRKVIFLHKMAVRERRRLDDC